MSSPLGRECIIIMALIRDYLVNLISVGVCLHVIYEVFGMILMCGMARKISKEKGCEYVGGRVSLLRDIR